MGEQQMKLATPLFLEADQYFKSLATMSHAPQLKSAFGIAYANVIGKLFEIDTEQPMETAKGSFYNHILKYHKLFIFMLRAMYKGIFVSLYCYGLSM